MVERGKVEGQERMEGEVFVLRSPTANNTHITIDAVQDGKTKLYRVQIAPTVYGVGRSLATALHELANLLDGARLYGSDLYDDEVLTGDRLRACDYCSGGIFFAKTHNQKWMPVEGKSISGKEAGKLRCYAIIDVQGSPTVQLLQKPAGQVWIAHPEICGANPVPPDSPVLRERWEKNRERTLARTEGAVHDLMDLLEDLEGE